MKGCTSNDLKLYNHLLGEIQAVYHEIALKFGLSDSELIALYTICSEDEPCLLRNIYVLSGLSKQTINSAVRKMENAGLIYLQAAGSKNKVVHLTESGKHLSENTALRLINAENEIFASWSRRDVEKYFELTEKYISMLKDKEKEL